MIFQEVVKLCAQRGRRELSGMVILFKPSRFKVSKLYSTWLAPSLKRMSRKVVKVGLTGEI